MTSNVISPSLSSEAPAPDSLDGSIILTNGKLCCQMLRRVKRLATTNVPRVQRVVAVCSRCAVKRSAFKRCTVKRCAVKHCAVKRQAKASRRQPQRGAGFAALERVVAVCSRRFLYICTDSGLLDLDMNSVPVFVAFVLSSFVVQSVADT